eukprot:snap_masked-scaffold_9-processed-gene-8.19-mRNA-1 protein AED:1.00 eAED:1.00 QI:0/0/0/0/1/1/2/0/62
MSLNSSAPNRNSGGEMQSGIVQYFDGVPPKSFEASKRVMGVHKFWRSNSKSFNSWQNPTRAK